MTAEVGAGSSRTGLGRSLRRAALNLARTRFGLDIRRVRPATTGATAAAVPSRRAPVTKSTVQFEVDEQFQAIYADATERAGTGNAEARMYNLVQALAYSRGSGRLVAECGVFHGHSAYVLCRYLQLEDPGFTGAGFHVFDSFEGLSDPTPADRVDDPSIPVAGVPRKAGLFKGTLAEVRDTLADFPEVTYHQGWIPDVFDTAPAGPYRMVHVDVDLHDPTRDSLAWFHPRLARGGVLVCDDYGFIRWPGARAAVDAYAAAQGVPVLSLSSAQALLFAPARA